MLPWCWFSSSSLAHNSSHLQWPQLFLWLYVWWHNISTTTTVIYASFLVKNKTAREKSGCCLEWLPWLNFLHPVTAFYINVFKYWDISIQEEGKIFPYSKFKNSKGKTILRLSSALSFVLNYHTTKKTGTLSLMETVFIKVMHHYPAHPLFTCALPLKLQLRKQKPKGIVKVQLFWQPTTERPQSKYKLSLFHTDTVIRCFEGSTFSVS